MVKGSRRNLVRYEHVFDGEPFDPLPESQRNTIDVIVSNSPCIPREELRMLPPEARLYELRRALDGGVDGLDRQRPVAADAPTSLRCGGHLLEASERRALVTADLSDQWSDALR